MSFRVMLNSVRTAGHRTPIPLHLNSSKMFNSLNCKLELIDASTCRWFIMRDRWAGHNCSHETLTRGKRKLKLAESEETQGKLGEQIRKTCQVHVEVLTSNPDAARVINADLEINRLIFQPEFRFIP